MLIEVKYIDPVHLVNGPSSTIIFVFVKSIVMIELIGISYCNKNFNSYVVDACIVLIVGNNSSDPIYANMCSINK